jgi:acyl carrier protein
MGLPLIPDSALLTEIDGWDSLSTVRLVLRLEEIIGRELAENDIENLKTIADVDSVLRSRLKETGHG